MAAIAPEVKAAAIADLVGGMSYGKTAAKHKVAKTTVVKWAAELNRTAHPMDVTPAESGPNQALTVAQRKQRFDAALDKFLFATIDMLNVWTEQCSDPAFIRSNPEGVLELGRTVLERADRLVSAISDQSTND